jgi:TfoX/Sxy family transcriptional regulator of competence genes
MPGRYPIAFEKPPPYMVELFDSILPLDSRVERRKMFGSPCGFVNGNMFCGLFEKSMFLRLSEADRAEAIDKLDTTLFDPMKGRPMREYVTLPDDLLEDEAQLDDWMGHALAYAGGLPPKEKKPRKSKAKAK